MENTILPVRDYLPKSAGDVRRFARDPRGVIGGEEDDGRRDEA